MAFFGITKETILTSRPHPGADRLSVCTLRGMDFQFVTGLNQFQVGDPVLYFPLDSLLPPEALAKLGLTGKLAGSHQNRVKTATLRGEISQGLVAAPGVFLTPDQMELDAEEITRIVGVTKYEPEPATAQGALLFPLPPGLSVYDIEGADRFTEAADALMDQPVRITEKMEGMNFSITLDAEGKLFVNQREKTIVPIKGQVHFAWTTAREEGLVEKIALLQKELSEKRGRPTQVTLYGELCGPGVQKNIYQLKTHRIFCFDLRHDGGFLPAPEFAAITRNHDLREAPVVSDGPTLREWLAGRTVKEASTGASLINPEQRREGIVIKPYVESRWSRGRLILKQHCPRYLEKSKI